MRCSLISNAILCGRGVRDHCRFLPSEERQYRLRRQFFDGREGVGVERDGACDDGKCGPVGRANRSGLLAHPLAAQRAHHGRLRERLRLTVGREEPDTVRLQERLQ